MFLTFFQVLSAPRYFHRSQLQRNKRFSNITRIFNFVKQHFQLFSKFLYQPSPFNRALSSVIFDDLLIYMSLSQNSSGILKIFHFSCSLLLCPADQSFSVIIKKHWHYSFFCAILTQKEFQSLYLKRIVLP